MMLRLFCRTGRFAGKEYRVEREAIIGRGRQNEIDLALDFISQRHVRIRFDEEASRYLVEDLGSRQGTEIDGSRVRGPRLLPDLCVLSLAGEIDFICQVVPDECGKGRQAVDRTVLAEAAPAPPVHLGTDKEDDSAIRPGSEDDKTVFDDAPCVAPNIPSDRPGMKCPGEQTPVTSSRERRLSVGIEATPSGNDTQAGLSADAASTAPDADPADLDGPRFFLVFRLEGDRRKEVELPGGETMVGRRMDSGVQIAHPTVGRRQALFIHHGVVLKLRDLGSANPTIVDGESIAGREVEIRAGSRIEFGAVLCVVSSR